MYKLKLHDLNDSFKMRKGERIIDLDKYVKLLKKNNILFTEEQYKAALKNFNKFND